MLLSPLLIAGLMPVLTLIIMKTITKSECLALIERLESGKCRCLKYNVECFCETADGPVVIGDVLGKMESQGMSYDNAEDILRLWSKCGFSKSLQEILGGAEVQEFVCAYPCSKKGEDGHFCSVEEITGKVADLFDFLNQIL